MKSKQQRIVITGGGGFIGSFLVERLLTLGYKNIVVLGRSKKIQSSGVEYRVCDINRDKPALNRLIRDGDIIIHLASSTMPAISEIDRIKDIKENVFGSLNLLEICGEKKIKKFIFISSGGTVYGGDKKQNVKQKFKESDNTDPKNSYGVIKISIEKYIGVFHHLYNLNHAILRVSNPYGRKFLKNRQLGVIDVFVDQAKNNETITIRGDGSNIRDYIHIDDVIDFLVMAIENKNISGIFNVGTGVGTSLRDVIKIIEQAAGKKVRVKYRKKRNADVSHNILDITKAKKTGWGPKHILSEDVKNMLST